MGDLLSLAVGRRRGHRRFASAVPVPGAAPPPSGTDGVGHRAGRRTLLLRVLHGRRRPAAASTIYLDQHDFPPGRCFDDDGVGCLHRIGRLGASHGERPRSRDRRGQPRARDASGLDGFLDRLRGRRRDRRPSGRRSRRLVDGAVRLADLLRLGVCRRLHCSRRHAHARALQPLGVRPRRSTSPSSPRAA